MWQHACCGDYYKICGFHIRLALAISHLDGIIIVNACQILVLPIKIYILGGSVNGGDFLIWALGQLQSSGTSVDL